MCLGQAACFCTSLNVFAPEKQQAAQLPNAGTIAVLMHGNALVSKAQSRQQEEGGKQGLAGVGNWTDETEIKQCCKGANGGAKAGQTWPPALLLDPPPSQ